MQRNLSFPQFEAALSRGVLWKHVNDYVELSYCLYDDGSVGLDVLTFDSECHRISTTDGGSYPDLNTAYISWCGFDGNVAQF